MDVMTIVSNYIGASESRETITSNISETDYTLSGWNIRTDPAREFSAETITGGDIAAISHEPILIIGGGDMQGQGNELLNKLTRYNTPYGSGLLPGTYGIDMTKTTRIRRADTSAVLGGDPLPVLSNNVAREDNVQEAEALEAWDDLFNSTVSAINTDVSLDDFIIETNDNQ